MAKKKKTEIRQVIMGREYVVSGDRINCSHTYMASSCQVCPYCAPNPDLEGFFYCTEGGKGLLDLSGRVNLSDMDFD